MFPLVFPRLLSVEWPAFCDFGTEERRRWLCLPMSLNAHGPPPFFSEIKKGQNGYTIVLFLVCVGKKITQDCPFKETLGGMVGNLVQG